MKYYIIRIVAVLKLLSTVNRKIYIVKIDNLSPSPLHWETRSNRYSKTLCSPTFTSNTVLAVIPPTIATENFRAPEIPDMNIS